MASFKKLLGKVFGGTLVGLAKKELVDKPREQAAKAQEEAQAQSLLAQQQAETAACSVGLRFRPIGSSLPSIQARFQKSAQRVLYVPTYFILCGSPAFPF